ncbi:sigma 54-interacting transcriptional regulator [Clostridium merdae]|uniref:sigma 54-interacting transcriptional regulator n=1 Tax=Clostridium merdae TaxID=1958780 RepID=UPI000A270B71|nr:sigma 54-interacting transcriptional regulator [Clostridium merdae]
MKEIRDIMIFSASDVFTSVARQIILRRRLTGRVGIIEGTGKNTIRNAKEAVSSGARVLIARGRNVRLLEENVSCPVVDVPYLYEEIYESVHMGNFAPEQIAMIGFDNAYDTMLRFQRISGMNVQVFNPESTDTIEQDVIGTLNPGTRLLIGGFSVKLVADAHQLQHVMLRVHSNNVEIAIDRALNILTSLEAKDEYLQTILATVNGTPDAVLNYSCSGDLLFLNDNAKALFHNQPPEEILRLLFPEQEIEQVLSQKKPSQKSIVKLFDRVFLVNCKPIIVNAQIKSVVVIVGSGNRIQSAEKQIRMKLNEKHPTARYTFDDIIGKSVSIQETIRLGKKYARSNSAILISGETGTGKEVFAQSIHTSSNRAAEPFVAINCAALPESILESELFGYVKGAFTGANKEGKMGLFELAHGGTVFLDEIGEMNIDVQAKLLRVLQEKEISRLGDHKIIPIDVRVISATNKNLEELVRERKFREDLLYRLNVLELNLPPLRDRKEDIPSLIEHYTSKNCPEITFGKEAISLLQQSNYPGNIRQFFNLLERTITLSDNTCILPEHLEGIIRRRTAGHTQLTAVAPTSTDIDIVQYEREKIKEVLQRSGGNRAQAAAELKISTTTLWRKLKKHHLIP